MQRQEALRAEVKALSREVGTAKKAGDEAAAADLMARSRALGDEEREAAHLAEAAGEAVRDSLLVIPNLPADETPDGLTEDDNVVIAAASKAASAAIESKLSATLAKAWIAEATRSATSTNPTGERLD